MKKGDEDAPFRTRHLSTHSHTAPSTIKPCIFQSETLWFIWDTHKKHSGFNFSSTHFGKPDTWITPIPILIHEREDGVQREMVHGGDDS